MKNTLPSFALFLWMSQSIAQSNTSVYRPSKQLTDSITRIIKTLSLDTNFNVGEDGIAKPGIAVIDLTRNKAEIGGINMEEFIYPASVYKMYVAMEILKQVRDGRLQLTQTYTVAAHNAVDKTREINFDPRPLLQAGDTVTINYLLDLMITRSDNSAANCLIDIADRKHINETMQKNGWLGSEVTRKFLKRTNEDPGYDTIRSTVTSALHAASFMYKIYHGQLENPWVSQQLKVLLGRQLDNAKLAAGLPRDAMFYHKTGWWSFYTHDVGIVDDGDVKYIIAVFLPLEESDANPKLKMLSARVYQLMKNLNTNKRLKTIDLGQEVVD